MQWHFVDYQCIFRSLQVTLGVRTSTEMKSSVICGRFVSILHPVKIPVPKIRICLTLVVLVFVNDAKSSVLLHFLAMTLTHLCLLWQSRQRLSLRCPQSSANFFVLCFLSISSCLLYVGL